MVALNLFFSLLTGVAWIWIVIRLDTHRKEKNSQAVLVIFFLFGFLSLVPLVLVARGVGLVLERELCVRPWTMPLKSAVVTGLTAIVVFTSMLLASRIPVALRYHDMGNALYWESDKRGQAPAELIDVCLEKAVHLDPTNPEFHNTLGKRYWRTQRHEESLQEAIRAAELDPGRLIRDPGRDENNRRPTLPSGAARVMSVWLLPSRPSSRRALRQRPSQFRAQARLVGHR